MPPLKDKDWSPHQSLSEIRQNAVARPPWHATHCGRQEHFPAIKDGQFADLEYFTASQGVDQGAIRGRRVGFFFHKAAPSLPLRPRGIFFDHILKPWPDQRRKKRSVCGKPRSPGLALPSAGVVTGRKPAARLGHLADLSTRVTMPGKVQTQPRPPALPLEGELIGASFVAGCLVGLISYNLFFIFFRTLMYFTGGSGEIRTHGRLPVASFQD